MLTERNNARRSLRMWGRHVGHSKQIINLFIRRKGNQANALRSLKEEVVISRQKSLKYFDRAVEPLGIVQDVMLKKAHTFCLGLPITAH